MCGFFGWLKFHEEFSDECLVKARNATSLLFHRGPDDRGEWIGKGIFMGHQRLKIIELTDKGAQPFISPDKRYVLTYNGEIYNYLEIKNELREKGFRFQTDSDTEVFLNAYIAWGTEAFNKLEGMFSAAIYDVKENTHILVRDHLGHNPLYYQIYEGGLIYGSEYELY